MGGSWGWPHGGVCPIASLGFAPSRVWEAPCAPAPCVFLRRSCGSLQIACRALQKRSHLAGAREGARESVGERGRARESAGERGRARGI